MTSMERAAIVGKWPAHERALVADGLRKSRKPFERQDVIDDWLRLLTASEASLGVALCAHDHATTNAVGEVVCSLCREILM
jgi:hypothetical protein